MEGKKPNVLIIMSDQHRLDCVGKANLRAIETPNIDHIAEEGMWFTNAYTPCPLCCPARQAYMSGLRPEKIGALWNYDLSLKIPSLTPDDQYFTKAFHENGYYMGYVGKWHASQRYEPTDFGFDDYISLEDYDAFCAQKYPERKFQNGFLGEIDPVLLEDSRTHWQAEKTINLIQEHQDEKPWFIQLSFSEPHLPSQPVNNFYERYRDQKIAPWGSFGDEFCDKPYIQKQQLLNWNIENYTWADWEPIVKRYHAIITQMDDAIGRVLRYLEENHLMENTIIVYTSDHGDMCGSHRMLDKHYVMYDDIVRVPLAIQWKGHIRSGSSCDAYVYNMLDVQPTLLDLCEIPSTMQFDGKSLLPIVIEQRIPKNWRHSVMCTYNGQQFGLYTERMYRKGRYKYIWNTTDVDEFYDMENDPWELNNLIHDDTVKSLIQEYRWMLLENLQEEQDDIIVRGHIWMRDQLRSGKKL